MAKPWTHETGCTFREVSSDHVQKSRSVSVTREDSRIRLLVVDDEQSIRRLCMTVGNSLDYACTEAESAEAALAQSPAIAPDLVIADLRLPNLSGADLLRQMKSRLPS